MFHFFVKSESSYEIVMENSAESFMRIKQLNKNESSNDHDCNRKIAKRRKKNH